MAQRTSCGFTATGWLAGHADGRSAHCCLRQRLRLALLPSEWMQQRRQQVRRRKCHRIDSRAPPSMPSIPAWPLRKRPPRRESTHLQRARDLWIGEAQRVERLPRSHCLAPAHAHTSLNLHPPSQCPIRTGAIRPQHSAIDRPLPRTALFSACWNYPEHAMARIGSKIRKSLAWNWHTQCMQITYAAYV